MNKIRWTRPTESGLCDRLVDFLFLIAYARIKKGRLVAEWMKFPAKPIDTQHRKLDILLENVQAHINLPHDLILDDGKATECGSSFDSGIGGGINYLTFHCLHLKDVCTYAEYEAAIQSVARDITFNAEITTFLGSLPKKFVSLHIRRGDKVRDGEHDGYFIVTSELEHLNSLTFQAIDYFLEAGYTTFFVCGDEDEKKKPFVDYIEAHGASIFSIPAMEKWKSTFYDIAVMTRSDFNIASQRYSNFSRFPALIGRGQFRTVFGFEI